MLRFITTLVLGTFLVAQGANLATAAQVKVSKKAIEQALDAKEADLDHARQMLANGTRSELPNGVVYRLPGAAGIVATLFSVGTGLTMIKPYIEARKVKTEREAKEVAPVSAEIEEINKELEGVNAPAAAAEKAAAEEQAKLDAANKAAPEAKTAVEASTAKLATLNKAVGEQTKLAADLANKDSEAFKSFKSDKDRSAALAEAQGAITSTQVLVKAEEEVLAKANETLAAQTAEVARAGTALATSQAAAKDLRAASEGRVKELNEVIGAKTKAIEEVRAGISKAYEPVRFRGKLAAVSALVALGGFGVQYWIERQYTVDLSEEDMMEIQAEIDQLSFEIDALRKQLTSF